MNVDTFDSIVESERRRVNRIVAGEIAALMRPEGERIELAQYMSMAEEMRKMVPPDERARLERLRRHMKAEV